MILPKENKPTRLRWLIALNLIAFTVLGARYFFQVQQQRAEEHAKIVDLADKFAIMGANTRDELIRGYEIGDRAFTQKRISDRDLDWCLEMIKTDVGLPPSKAEGRRQTALNVVSSAIVNDALTPSQREKVYQAAIADLLRNDAKAGDHVSRAAGTLRQLKDRRAIPFLKPYLNDSNPRIRRYVKFCIEKIEAPKVGSAAGRSPT